MSADQMLLQQLLMFFTTAGAVHLYCSVVVMYTDTVNQVINFHAE